MDKTHDLVNMKLSDGSIKLVTIEELPTHYILAKIHSEDGSTEHCYIDPACAKLPSKPKHTQLEGELLTLATATYERISEVIDMTLSEWLDGFRDDFYMDEEVVMWNYVSSVYKVIAENTNMNSFQRREMLWILVACLSEPSERIISRNQSKLFTTDHVRWIVEQFHQNSEVLTDALVKVRLQRDN